MATVWPIISMAGRGWTGILRDCWTCCSTKQREKLSPRSEKSASQKDSVVETMKTIIEPFKIKIVEPIKLTTPAERETILRRAHFNVFQIRFPAGGKIIVDCARTGRLD